MQTPTFFRLAFKALSVFLAFIGIAVQAFTQSTPQKLTVMANAVSDSTKIIIRWAPADYATFLWGNEHGYRLERTTMSNADTSLTVSQMIASKVTLDSMILPLAEANWETWADSNDMAGVAASTIYGDSLEVPDPAVSDFINVYNVSEQRQNRYSFGIFAADHGIDIAQAMGLGYVDTTVEAGKEYYYVIKLNNVPDSIELKRGSVTIATNDVYQPPVPDGIAAIPGDSTVILTWVKQDEHYTSYIVERSSDNGQTWQQVNERPLIFTDNTGSGGQSMQFFDSLAQNNTLYIYRVKGCSPFGLMGPASDTVHVIGKPAPLSAFPVITLVEEDSLGGLKLTWDFPSEYDDNIEGFDIYRAKSLDSAFTKINMSMLSETTREFIDSDPYPVNYYQVRTIDENGYELNSYHMLGQPKDETPPSAPGSLTGQSNKAGMVTLTWTKSPEEDVQGYRVFISNVPDEEFSQITTTWINDTIYRYGLNLNTLSETVYFAVKAIDFRENQSEFSPVCAVQRPDIIPPAAPNITKVTAEPGKVYFEWALSSSEDVEEYKFQRKPNGSPGWSTLLTFDPNDTLQQTPLRFIDSTASVRKWYDYRLIAKDDAGLIGSSKVIKAKPVDNGVRDSIENFDGELLGSGAHTYVLLEWDFPGKNDPDLLGFQIFRAIDTNAMRSYKFITVEEAGGVATNFSLATSFGFRDIDLNFSIPVQTVYTFTDSQVSTGGNPSGGGNTIYSISPNVPVNPSNGVTLKYWVMAKFIDGGFSPLSPAVEIQM